MKTDKAANKIISFNAEKKMLKNSFFGSNKSVKIRTEWRKTSIHPSDQNKITQINVGI